MNKTLAIYFSDPEPMGYPFSKEDYYVTYKSVITDIEKHGIHVYIVRADSYQGNGIFSQGWRFAGEKLEKSSGPVAANLIWNRDDKNTIPRITDCAIINQPEFDELCTDKAKTYEAFPNLSPKSAAIHSYQAYLEQIQEWQLPDSVKIVLKKNFETEGRGIHILPIKEVSDTLYGDWSNILVQEFLDSSCGIPGLTEGLHDLRVTVVNGVPINSFMRTPKKGSFLANVAQGGTGTSVPMENVPEEVISLVHTIDESFKKYFPAAYAADFMNTQHGYKLIELNSRPGVQHPNWSKTYQKFNDTLVDMIVNAL